MSCEFLAFDFSIQLLICFFCMGITVFKGC